MKFLKYLIWMGLTVLVLGEILTRLFIPLDLSKRLLKNTTDHPYLRYDWLPGFESTYQVRGIGDLDGPMTLKINAFGFRSSSMRTAQKPAGTTRIFFLGESTTECITLPEEKTFPFLVEKKLTEAFPGRRFECVNAAMSGTFASDSLATLIYKVMHYSPDTVIVMHAVNDLRYGAFPTYDPVTHPDLRKKILDDHHACGLFQSLKDLMKRSRFLTLIKWRIVDRLSGLSSKKPDGRADELIAECKKRRSVPLTESPPSKALDEFIRNLQDMISIARGNGTRLILMTEPFLYQKNMPEEMDRKLWMGYLEKAGLNLSNDFLLKEMNRFNDAVRTLARENGVELIDLEKEIPKDLAHFYDDVHLTPEGSQRAAEAISDYLIKHPRGNTP